MKKFNLFTKIITPIIIIGIVFSYMGYMYLHSIVEANINNEIKQKLENKIQYAYDIMQSEFKLLFYLYGTSASDYEVELKAAKKDIFFQLKEINKNNNDIVYIIDPNEYIQLSNSYLTSSELSTIVRTHQKSIIIKEKEYRIMQLYFKPWKWNIVYLLDISSFEEILNHNKNALFGIVYLLLIILIIIMIIMFKLYIKNPVDLLLAHFNSITKGKYNHIYQNYNTNELDLLISDVNNMTKSIQYREEEYETLLGLTKKSEEYMKDVLSSQSSMIIINDMTKIIDVNDSFLEFFNEFKSLKEFQKKHHCVCDYFVKEEGFIYTFEDKNWVKYVLENPDILHKVKILKNNEHYIYTIQAKKSEKFDRIIITMIDITELEKSNNLLEQYKKAVDAGTIVSKTNPKGIITYVNDKFVNISGYSREELLGSPHNMVNSKNTEKSVFKDMWKTIKSKKIWNGSIENRKKDGSSYFVVATIIPILDENEKIIEYIALRHDITAEVQAVEKAKKAENTKSLFLANMSHEIRTPLNAIIGFTKILKNSELKKKEANYINVIDQSAENLLGIVNDVLDITKIENGSLVCESIEFNPFKEFNAVSDLFSATAKEKNIEIISTIDHKILQKLIGDPLRIKQVLSNLISNAIKFSSQNSKIEFTVDLVSQSSKQCKLLFSVKDYGIGIDKNKQETIFQDFTQADDSTSREYGGTGLGLSISNKLINALGSKIEIESEEGKGSNFFFTLEYEIDEFDNKNLEELNKLEIGIILSKRIEEYDYQELKVYLESVTNVTIYKDIENVKNIDEKDLLILDETNPIDKIIELDKKSSNKIILLSHEQKKYDKLQNSLILNTPFNRSIVFDILAGFIDGLSLIDSKEKVTYEQFKGKILIAEDHKVNQQLISMLLDLRGIEYEFANNGQEAVTLFSLNKYDMIFMDINMPIKNGKEATSEIIALENQNNLKHTPIVALTANVIETDREETMKIGFDGYLLKPLDEIKLDEVFRKYLSGEKKTPEKTFEKVPSVSLSKNIYSLEKTSELSGLPVLVLKKIVANFISTIDSDISALEVALHNKDFDEVANYSHKIKGAALNLRMDNISEISTKIESQANKKEDISLEEDIKILIDEISVIKNLEC